MSRMHPQLTAALNRLDAATRDLRAAVDAVPVALRAQKPSPDRWSVNEVVEHLAKVEQIFFGTLLARLESARTSGLCAEVEAPPALPEQTRMFMVDRTNARKAPEPAQPTGAVDAVTALQMIDAGQARLKDALQACDGLALSSVTHEHRFFGTLNVYQWLELMAAHSGRHTAQLREAAAQVTGA
jgi:hypothetical protein